MNGLRRGAEWIASLRYEDIPERVILKSKLQILSFLASVFAGNISDAPSFLKGMRVRSGEATSLLLPFKRCSPLDAIFVNTTLSMVHDYDDYTFLAHTGHSAVGVSLALCEEYGLSGKDLIRGVVIGNELEGRLGASVVLGPLNGQMVSHIHSAGASAIHLSLLRSSPSVIEKGIILALSHPQRALLPSFMWGDTKLLTASLPSVQGVICGMVAESADVSEEVLYGEGGFFSRFSFLPLYSMLTGWGKVWTTNAISYKIYPGCAYIDSAVDCMIRIMERFRRERGRDLREEDVKEVRVETTLLSYIMERHSERFRGEHLSPVNINFSISLSLALLLLKGELSPKVLRKDLLRECEGKLKSLASKVKVIHNPEMTVEMIEEMTSAVNFLKLPEMKLRGILRAYRNLRREHGNYLSLKDGLRLLLNSKNFVLFIKGKKINDLSETSLDRFSTPFSARVILRTEFGDYEDYEKHPLGGAGRPLDETERLVKEKFVREGKLVGGKFSEVLIERVMSIEKLGDVRELFG